MDHRNIFLQKFEAHWLWWLSLPLLAFTLFMFGVRPTQAAAPQELTQTVLALDAAVFDAYNTCNPEKFGKYFAEDVEFYHDKGGVSKGRATLLEALKNNICHKVRRELVTTEVFPMDNFGALQTGVHRFHHPGREKEDGVGEAKFIHLWQKRGEEWVITRVISYDHRARSAVANMSVDSVPQVPVGILLTDGS